MFFWASHSITTLSSKHASIFCSPRCREYTCPMTGFQSQESDHIWIAKKLTNWSTTHNSFHPTVPEVHSRFSTNSFPSWNRAHPFRRIAHNGILALALWIPRSSHWSPESPQSLHFCPHFSFSFSSEVRSTLWQAIGTPSELARRWWPTAKPLEMLLWRCQAKTKFFSNLQVRCTTMCMYKYKKYNMYTYKICMCIDVSFATLPFCVSTTFDLEELWQHFQLCAVVRSLLLSRTPVYSIVLF